MRRVGVRRAVFFPKEEIVEDKKSVDLGGLSR